MFGYAGNFDFYIYSNCNSSDNNQSFVGNCFESSVKLKNNSLASGNYFKVKEIEIFEIYWRKGVYMN